MLMNSMLTQNYAAGKRILAHCCAADGFPLIRKNKSQMAPVCPKRSAEVWKEGPGYMPMAPDGKTVLVWTHYRRENQPTVGKLAMVDVASGQVAVLDGEGMNCPELDQRKSELPVR